MVSGLVPHVFDAIRDEVEDLCGFWFSEVDEMKRQILHGLVGMARRFAVVINKFYAKEVGRAFAEIASDRFRAAYL